MFYKISIKYSYAGKADGWFAILRDAQPSIWRGRGGSKIWIPVSIFIPVSIVQSKKHQVSIVCIPSIKFHCQVYGGRDRDGKTTYLPVRERF